MNLDDDFRNQEFELNPGLIHITNLNQQIAQLWYQKEIMANQIRILQFLQTGKIDEDKVIQELQATLDRLSSRIERDYYDAIADLQVRPDDPDSPAE
jgi:hypothetical protein